MKGGFYEKQEMCKVIQLCLSRCGIREYVRHNSIGTGKEVADWFSYLYDWLVLNDGCPDVE